MRRKQLVTTSIALALAIAAGIVVAAPGAVRMDEWTKMNVPGLGKLGRMAMGGADGTIRTIAVNGDATRMAIQTKNTIVIRDLQHEANFTIKKNRCVAVTTFVEMREQWEQLSSEGGPFAAMKSGGGERPADEPPEPQYEVDVKTTDLGSATVDNIEGKKMKVVVTLREAGMKIEESGGVILEAVTVHGDSDVMRKRHEFDKKYMAALGQALQVGEMLKEFKDAFMKNSAVEQAMAEFQKASIDDTSVVLASETTVRQVPDPRQPAQAADEPARAEDPQQKLARGLMKGARKMFGKKNKQQEAEGEGGDGGGAPDGPRKVMETWHELRNSGAGGDELLTLPDDCLKQLAKKTS